MSDPYRYNQQGYPQQQYGGYGQAPPQPQYPPQQGGYAPPPQPSYAGSAAYGQPNPYEQQSQYPQQPQYGQDQAYGHNQQYGAYGPPATGGFQHAQSPPAPGQYDAQAYGGYDQQRQESYPGSRPGEGQFPQQGAYNQSPHPGDPNAPDGERGIMGALSGGFAGGYGGHKLGHAVVGAISGALLGSAAEDKYKASHKKHNSGIGHHGRREGEY